MFTFCHHSKAISPTARGPNPAVVAAALRSMAQGKVGQWIGSGAGWRAGHLSYWHRVYGEHVRQSAIAARTAPGTASGPLVTRPGLVARPLSNVVRCAWRAPVLAEGLGAYYADRTAGDR
jgi:hypothetical protein